MPTSDNRFYRDLSLRQVQILALVERGFTQRQIAEQLGVSPSTVHSHILVLEELTGRHSMQELGWFWTEHKRPWLRHMALMAGIEEAM